MTVLGIIPARGGSKGVPRKNLARVGGRSLVRRAIEALRESRVCDAILVSTEDREIADEALAAGGEVDQRPQSLAADEVSTEAVLLELLARRGKSSGEILVLAEPNHPFRQAATVRAAVETYRRGGVGSVVAVFPLQHKPQYIFRKAAGTLRRYVEVPAESFLRRQEMDHLCRLSGAAWVVGAAAFCEAEQLLRSPIGWVDSQPYEAVNIDTPLDLAFAQFLADKERL